MAFITLAVLSFAGGLLYSKDKSNNKGVSVIKRAQKQLAPIKAHKNSLKIFTDESDNSEDTEQALADKRELKKTLTIFAGSSTLAIGGSLFFPPLALLSIPGAVYLLRDVYINTGKTLVKGRKLSVDPLMAIFTTSMLFQGYFVVSHFFISLYILNRQLVKRVRQESKKNIIDVFRDQPRTAWTIIDGSEIELPVEQIQEGDIIVVKTGESIPVDGEIISGFASIDQHMLTGESQPTEKTEGDTVFACTVLLTGAVQIKVEKTGEATASARIGQILNDTVDFKTQKQLWAERFTDQTVLPTLGLSAITLALAGPIPALIVINSHFRYRLTLATSTCALTFLNLAAQKGLLLKSGVVLENMQTVDTVVFDKTGTLTLETPHVVNVSTFDSWDANTIVGLAASIEARQSHPVAKAICSHAESLDLTLEESVDASYQIGYGLVASIDAKQIQVGSLRYAKQQGLTIPDALLEQEAHCHEVGNSLIVVSINNSIAGAIELQATLREETESVIKALREQGLSLHIISGDHPAPTKMLANTLGIDNYHAEVLPENKAAIIKQLQDEGRSVCFIGDGINDAIALKEAAVSVSLRGASSVATDTAEVILMDQDLNRLCDLFQLAKEYDQNVTTTSRMITVPSVMNLALAFVPQFGLTASMSLSAASVLAGFGSSMMPLLKHQQQLNSDAEESDITPSTPPANRLETT
ncbi:heavy metal translocating P-type ATPase [Leucothrix arctica]|uniref:P-type Zn(2+) transporter n=1 Tax=Leucothrix arctica TaxID=1481894 RepID=A0A317CEG2_9GAMM|nr:heavy metal translocating P-type ATPase [Leucothrix arctica]PWQ97075.1 heavy metal translocating P-type ATPase [Leucothrix arctica]